MKRIAILALKYSLILSLFLCFKLNVQAQAICPLLKGDIFISAYDMADDQNDGTTKDDKFSFVMLKKVNAGQVIFFTDFGYINATNQFQTPVKAVSDGIIKWTADKDYEAGTEIIINCKFTLKATLKDNTTAAGTVTSALESYNTRVLYTGDPKEYMSLAEFSGDQIFAFLLPATNGATDFTTGITFLAGVSANVSSGGWATNLSANVSDASLSELPAQLNSGAQNLTLSFNNNDNTDGFTNDGFAGRHKNKITNTSAAILANANTTTNWEYASNFYPDPNFVPLLTPANYALSPLTLGIVADRLNICRNTATTFTAVTTNACSYQWQTRTSAGTFADISNGGIYGNSATTNTLTISSGNTVDGNYYRVLVRGNGGTQTSNEARLTTVDPAIVLTSAALPASFKGAAYPNQTIGIVSGGAAPYAFSSTGTLPPGLTLSPTTGVISGTPTAAGTFNFTVTATSACTSTGSQSYSIVIKEILVTPATLATQPTIGKAYTQALAASGGTAPYSYAISAGSLPAGLTLSAATGNITGTATASGNFNFTVSATDSSPLPGPFSGSTNYSITTNVPTIIVGPTTLASTTAGAAYSQTATASGGTAPYTYTISAGTLPTGLTLSAATGNISGTPTATGTFNFSVRATDSSTGTGAPFSGARAYTIIVNTPIITINPATVPNAVIGTAYSQTLTADNGTAPYTFAITAGGLPTGLTLSATGLLSGTPTAGGTFNFTVSAQDATTGAGAPFSGARAYSMTVTPPTITIAPTTIPAAVAGTIYSQNITASGGTSGYSYALTAGTLPAGITLNSAGLLSGIARGTGTFNFTVTATDASTGAGPYTGARAYTFSVGAPVIIVTPASLPSATIALAYSQTLGSAGGTAPYTYAITAGSLPTGLTLSTGGVISGTPTGGGFFNFTVTATDATTGGTYGGSKVYSLNVNAPAITLTLTAATVTIGVPYSRTVTAAGGTAPYAFAITAGALPAGLTLASNGVLSGTPTAGGTFNFTITATDNSTGAGPYTGSAAYIMAVAAPTISIIPTTLSNGVAGIAYIPANITSSGGTAPYTYAISAGSLPAGLSLSAGGVLSGTPTAAGTFNFTLRATDASTGSGPYAASRAYTMTIGAPTIAVSPATLSNGTLGTTYNEIITATGGTTPHTFVISAGALPTGLTLSPNGVLSGTPAVFGNFNFTVMATDQTTGAGPFNASRGYTLSIQFSPKITSATYDAATGTLAVTGIGFPPSSPTADVSKLVVKANGFTYPLTAATVSNSNATSFTTVLNATDRLAVMLNKNGTTGVDGSTYNLSAVANWFTGAPADAAGGVITVSNVSLPTISSAVYNASTSVLIVTGTNLIAYPGAGNDIAVSKLAITAEGNTYTLTSADVELSSATAFAVTLNAADQLALKPLFNKNGTQSTNGTIYNIAAAEDWLKAAEPAANIADLTSNGITVNNVAIPTITSATYQTSTGTLTVTGANLLSLSGTANDIVASKFTIKGEGGSTYTLTNTPNVDITNNTTFTLTLSTIDQLGVNAIVNKNGTSSTNGTIYNLAAADDWAAGADVTVDVTDLLGNGINVNGVAAPAITSAVYDAASGQLVVTGTGFLFLSGTANDIVANKFSFIGQGGSSYNLTNTPNVDITSPTEFTLTLSTTDKAALKPLLNKNGTSSRGGTTYNLAALEDWNAGADASVNIVDLVNSLTAVNALSTVADLSSLTTSAGSLNPSFATNTTTYTVNTVTTSNTATVTAVLADLTATMEVSVNTGTYTALSNNTASGNFPLNFGNNIINVKVTAEDASVKTYTLTVNRPNASQTITLAPTASVAYGTPDYDPGATSATSAINAITYTSSDASVATIVNGKIHIVGLGITNIIAKQAGSLGLDAAPDAQQVLTVIKGTASIALSNLAQIYDGTAKAVNATTTPAGLSGVSITYNGSAIAPIAAGTYVVTASLANTNYDAPNATGSLVIAPKAITVTADAQSKTYGLADPALTYNIPAGSLVGTDAITGSLNRAPGENVGVYVIGQNTLTAGNNYTITYAPANLTIGTKTITVTADAKSKTYGSADPALTYNIPAGSLVGTDAITGSLNRAPGENVGVYVIGQNTLTAGNNYTITYVPANLTIGTKAITVSADAQSKTYGSADPALTYSLPAGSLVGTDAITGSLNRVPGENVGVYAIGQNTLTAGNNYTITYAPANLTIGTKTITVTADAKSKTYGSADPALTYNIPAGSLVGTDAITGSLNRVPGENVGVYAIGQNTLTAGNNYTITYVPANLTIGTKTITVSADVKSKTYGSSDPALTYSVPAGSLVGTDAITGSLNRAPGENVGVYAIGQNTVTAGNNYTITYVPANLTIGTKTITVSADAKSKTYGSSDPALTYSVPAGSLVGTDAITGSLNRAAGESVGTYAIGQNTLTAGNNYTITYVPANLTIGTKAITVTADAKSKTYGSADPALTYSVPAGSLVGTDAITGSLNRVTGENVGTYAIGQNTLTAGNNYTITYNTANLTINPKALTITADGKTRVFGVANPALTVSYNGFITGESSTVLTSPAVISTTATIASPSGTYPITASGAAAANYSISYVPGSLVITATSQSITFAALANKLSTDAPFTLTATATSGLAVSYSSSDVSVARIINGNQVEILKAGVVTITASQAGNGNYTAAAAVSQSLTVLDNPAPIISIVSSKGNSISKGITTVLTASGALTYSWSNASGIISGQNTASLTVRPAQTTTYTVTGANQYGRTSTQNITIEVLADYKALNITNALSPNGDGVNDFWIVENIDMYPNNTVKIVDRSGRSVYEKKGYDNSWDGNFRGAQLAEGTYYYIIDFGPGIGFRKGFITIVR